ncbi:MAG: pentapeptide repeat-containing protein [Lachnospiraceae bacterium]|nr:pentapeptide repeat-containing protein [Lachnospiraceae bacterium]
MQPVSFCLFPLSEVSLPEVSLSEVSLSKISLSEVSLSEVSLSEVSLSEVSLSEVCFLCKPVAMGGCPQTCLMKTAPCSARPAQQARAGGGRKLTIRA